MARRHVDAEFLERRYLAGAAVLEESIAEYDTGIEVLEQLAASLRCTAMRVLGEEAPAASVEIRHISDELAAFYVRRHRLHDAHKLLVARAAVFCCRYLARLDCAEILAKRRRSAERLRAVRRTGTSPTSSQRIHSAPPGQIVRSNPRHTGAPPSTVADVPVSTRRRTDAVAA